MSRVKRAATAECEIKSQKNADFLSARKFEVGEKSEALTMDWLTSSICSARPFQNIFNEMHESQMGLAEV